MLRFSNSSRGSRSSRLLVVALLLTGWAAPGRAQEDDSDALAGDALDAPPSPLVFTQKTLRMFAPTDGRAKGKVYWYMTYTLENRSDEDVSFFVSIVARGDRKDTYSDLYLPELESAIERREKKSLWGQTDRFEEISKKDPSDEKYNYVTLKAGEKRECVAVFSEFNASTRKVTIEVYGLSDKLEIETAEDGTIKVLEAVRVLEFERIGDEYGIDQDRFRFKDRSWTKKETAVAAE